MKDIAVLLTVHNRKNKTIRCLELLSAQDITLEFRVDVFLTDDGSTDGTSAAIQEQFPNVNIIKGDGTLYWNRGMYVAWKAAVQTKDYDYYLWLNDDTAIKGHTLRTLLNVSEELENEAIVVGTTTATQSDEYTYGGRTSKGKLIVPTDYPVSCAYFNGNVVLFPRIVYINVGFNDPYFRHALGDFDYGLRAKKLGVKSFVAPGILGSCDMHDSLPTWCNPKRSFTKRWKAFRTPLGHNPEEFFVFEKRHNNLAKAVFHYITNHIRVICPKLWLYRITN